MLATIRRKIAMAKRALDFSMNNPSADVSYAAVVGELKDLVEKGRAETKRQRDGLLSEQGAIEHRKDLRNLISSELRHVAAVAERVFESDVEKLKLFTLPDGSGTNRAFIAAAEGMLEAATPDKDELVKAGLGEGLLADLDGAVAEFNAATEAAHAGRAAHVGATSELTAVATESVKVVGLLDGLNRLRFRDQEGLLAAWESAKNVAGPFEPSVSDVVEPEPKPVPGPVVAPVEGQAPEVVKGVDPVARQDSGKKGPSMAA